MATNESGGVVYEVDSWTLLQRFLIIGNESGDYRVNAKELEIQNLHNVAQCWSIDGQRTLDMILNISTTGRAVKNNTCLAALAWGFVHPDVEIRRRAAAALPKIARTLSHLITFVDYVTKLRGWGRLLKRAVGSWFQDKTPKILGYQFVKYQNRKGWRTGDLLRLAHPTPKNKIHDSAYFWATGGDAYQLQQEWFDSLPFDILEVTRLHAMVEAGEDTLRIVRHIAASKIPWEAIPSQLLSRSVLWVYLHRDVPNEAFLRNITRMGSVGLMNPGSVYVDGIVQKILKMQNVHPMQFLLAYVMYRTGVSVHDQQSWPVNQLVLGALETSFFRSFSNIKPTGKRIVLAIDRSGSMRRSMVDHIPGFSSVEAAAALAGAILKTEEHKIVLGFNNTATRIKDLESMVTLESYTNFLRSLAKGGTNCASPIDYCIENNVDPDAIIILTDAQHWDGPLPGKALQELRARVGHAVKLVVVCTTTNKWSTVCPNDPDVMNIVGFDSHAVRLIQDFISGGETGDYEEEDGSE